MSSEEKQEEEDGTDVLEEIMSNLEGSLEGMSDSESDEEGEGEHISVQSDKPKPSKKRRSKRLVSDMLPSKAKLEGIRRRRGEKNREPPHDDQQKNQQEDLSQLFHAHSQSQTFVEKDKDEDKDKEKEKEKEEEQEEEEEEEEDLDDDTWVEMMKKKEEAEREADEAYMKLARKVGGEEKEEEEEELSSVAKAKGKEKAKEKEEGEGEAEMVFLDDDRESTMTGATDDSKEDDSDDDEEERLSLQGTGDAGFEAVLFDVTGKSGEESLARPKEEKEEVKEEVKEERRKKRPESINRLAAMLEGLGGGGGGEEEDDEEEKEVVNIDDIEGDERPSKNLLARKPTGYDFLQEEEMDDVQGAVEKEQQKQLSEEQEERQSNFAQAGDEHKDKDEGDEERNKDQDMEEGDGDDDDGDMSLGLGIDSESEGGSEIIRPEEEEGEVVLLDRGLAKDGRFETMGDLAPYLFIFALLAIIYQTSVPTATTLIGVRREGELCLGFLDHCGFGSQCEWFRCKKLMHLPHPWLASVDNQGACGSCWAIASTHVFNDQLILNSGGRAKGLKLSSQNVMECAAAIDPEARDPCAGGKPMSAMKTITLKGVHEEYQEPYVGKAKGRCITSLSPRYFPRALGILRGGEKSLIEYLYHKGPAVVVMKVHWNFFTFFDRNPKAVYATTNQSPYVGFHSIEIVGYGQQSGTKFWVAKNTWGKGWADKGYFRILRGKNFCDVEDLALTTISSTVSTKGIVGYRQQQVRDRIVERVIAGRIKAITGGDTSNRNKFVPSAENVPLVHTATRLLKDELEKLYGCKFDVKRIVQADIRVVAGLRAREVLELEPSEKYRRYSNCVAGFFDGEVWLMLPSQSYTSAVPYLDQYADCTPRWRSLLEWVLLPLYWRTPVDCKTRYQVMNARRIGKGSFPPPNTFNAFKNWAVVSGLLGLLFVGKVTLMDLATMFASPRSGQRQSTSRSRKSKRLSRHGSKQPRNVRD